MNTRLEILCKRVILLLCVSSVLAENKSVSFFHGLFITGYSKEKLSVLHPEWPPPSVKDSIFPLGPNANKVRIPDKWGGDAFVVNSGDSSQASIVMVRWLLNFKKINLPGGSNPYDVGVYKDKLIVSLLMRNQLVIIDTATGKITDSIGVGSNPQDLLIVGDRLYVANSGFGYDSTISVVDLKQKVEVKRVTVGTNPTTIERDPSGLLHILTSGISWPKSDSSGSIVFYDPKLDSIVGRLHIGNNPYQLVIDSVGLGFTSDPWAANGAGTYRYDFKSRKVLNSPSNPIPFAGGLATTENPQFSGSWSLWVTMSYPNQIVRLDRNLKSLDTVFTSGPPHSLVFHQIYPDALPNIPSAKPTGFQIASPYPNPFNPLTRLSWQPVHGQVEITVFDQLGKLLQTFETSGGITDWKPTGLSSGTYLLRFKRGNEIRWQKATLLK